MSNPLPNITIVEHANLSSPQSRQFTVSFDGIPITTYVTSDSDVLRRWIVHAIQYQSQIRERVVVGLGVNSGHIPVAATIQLCISHTCIIFQFFYSYAIPPILFDFLTCPNFTLVGVRDTSNSESMLNMREPRLQEQLRTVNLSLSAGVPEASVDEMVRVFLGYPNYVHDPGLIASSDWTATHLSGLQVQYACVDAYISWMMGLQLGAS